MTKPTATTTAPKPLSELEAAQLVIWRAELAAMDDAAEAGEELYQTKAMRDAGEPAIARSLYCERRIAHWTARLAEEHTAAESFTGKNSKRRAALARRVDDLAARA